MKLTVKGISYNLDDSTFLASWNNDEVKGSSDYIQETLFQTPTKQFFLLTEGPGISRHNPPGKATVRSEILLTPITDSEAIDWIAECDLPGQTEDTFAISRGIFS